MTAGGNLFADLSAPDTHEHVTALLSSPQVRIERIVSHGQASPSGFWYDQEQSEWVVVLSGSARLRLDGEELPRELHAGDYLLIPAHLRHRVEWTDPARATIWLAVHLPA